MAGLLSGGIIALSAGFSEAVAMAKAGEVNIIGDRSFANCLALFEILVWPKQVFC